MFPLLPICAYKQFWQAGKEDWKLLKVAVVELRNDVFVARLFFGEGLTGDLPQRQCSRCCGCVLWVHYLLVEACIGAANVVNFVSGSASHHLGCSS